MLDNNGNIDIDTLRAVDKSCGDKLSHGMTSSIVSGVVASEGHWEGSVLLTPCDCLLCRMAIEMFQVPPHSPNFTFGETKYIPKAQSND